MSDTQATRRAKRSVALVQNPVEAPLAITAPAAPAVETIETTPTPTINEEGARKAQTIMENTMQQMTKSTEGFYKAAEEAAEFGRGNLDAMTRATQMLTSGMQDLGKQCFAMSQALTDHAMESAKALSAVKSLKEAADIQAAFAKAAMERTMSETAKLQEAAYRLAEQAGAPIAARMTLAVEKFGKPLAA